MQGDTFDRAFLAVQRHQRDEVAPADTPATLDAASWDYQRPHGTARPG